MAKKALFYFLLLILVGRPGLAQDMRELPFSIEAHSLSVTPDEELWQKWVNDYVTDEIWFFRHYAELEQLLSAASIELPLQEKIRRSTCILPCEDLELRSRLYRSQTTILRKSQEHVVAVLLDKELKSSLPAILVRDAYQLQAKAGVRRMALEIFDSLDQVESFLITAGVAMADRDRLRGLVFKSNGEYFIPLAPDTWSVVSREWRNAYLQKKIGKAGDTAYALSVVVRGSERIQQTAEILAFDRDPEVLSRYLRRRMSASPGAVLSIPLQEVMPPFVRQYLGSFSECDGPNCFNAGLNTNRRKRISLEHTTSDDLLRELVQGYRPVVQEESLRIGDLLVYCDAQGNPLHVSVYINREFAFSKNGLKRFSPYVFVKHSELDHLYFSGGSFLLYAFRANTESSRSANRPPEVEGGLTIEKFGALYFSPIRHFSVESLKRLGLDPRMHRAEWDQAVLRIPTLIQERFVSPYWIDQMVFEPRFAPIREKLKQALGHFDSKLFSAYLKIGYNPLGTVRANQDALIQLLVHPDWLSHFGIKELLARLRQEGHPEYQGILDRIQPEATPNCSPWFLP